MRTSDNPHTSPLLDVAGCAERLGVPVRMVRRLVHERRIPYSKVGKYVRFDPSDVDEFIAAGRVEVGASG